ncbi:MAG: hypothetical protein OEV60_13005 [Actinomycetota bacterium]|nr:hypothetical protein [Actinomycetota bacterium]MDH5223224.1 hypothetical protein [Actinomycetota bacterium]MDH5314808.1 hypothetical protein [Actinomycetota bacterium]
MALVFLGGLLDAPGVTARASLLPDVASWARWSLERATGPSAVVERASRLAGAPLAGVLIAIVGATSVLWIDAASFLVSAALVAVSVPRKDRGSAVDGDQPASDIGELREGFVFLHRDRTLFTLVAVLTFTNMLDAISISRCPSTPSASTTARSALD